MPERLDTRVAAVINVLADLCPSSRLQARSLVVPTEWFRWRPIQDVALFKPPYLTMSRPSVIAAMELDRLGGPGGVVQVDRDYGERLAAIDRLRTDHRPLRAASPCSTHLSAFR